MENKIKYFWKCSIENNMDSFDFHDFFVEFTEKLRHKLMGHGQLSLPDYIKHISKFYNVELLKQFAYKSEHTGYEESYEDILKSVFEKRYIHFNDKFSESKIYNNMVKIYGELLHREDLTRAGKVFLVDKCIDLQHHSGFVIDVDIGKLKKEFEKKKK